MVTASRYSPRWYFEILEGEQGGVMGSDQTPIPIPVVKIQYNQIVIQ